MFDEVCGCKEWILQQIVVPKPGTCRIHRGETFCSVRELILAVWRLCRFAVFVRRACAVLLH